MDTSIVDNAATLMRSTANELLDMKSDILRNFVGIGHERCADCLERIANSYGSSAKIAEYVHDPSQAPVANPSDLR